MSITARLATTAIAGLAGYGVVGIYTLIAGPAETYFDLAVLTILFTAVYVPGVFGARHLLRTQARQAIEALAATTP